MNLLRSTLRLYAEALREAVYALPRSWPAAAGLALYSLLLTAIDLLTLGLNPSIQFAMGFLTSLIHAGCVGSYLHLLERAVTGRRSLSFPEVQESFGAYLWDVISVLFLFFIAGLLLSVLGLGAVAGVLMVAAMVAFNPAPELIYQGRSRSLELLKDAARYMRQSGLTWLAPQLLLLGAGALLLPGQILFLAQGFGPFFGFMKVGTVFFMGLLYGLPSVGEVLGFLASLVLVHLMMLFRGFLFQKTQQGGARLRAWQERLRGG